MSQAPVGADWCFGCAVAEVGLEEGVRGESGEDGAWEGKGLRLGSCGGHCRPIEEGGWLCCECVAAVVWG